MNSGQKGLSFDTEHEVYSFAAAHGYEVKVADGKEAVFSPIDFSNLATLQEVVQTEKVYSAVFVPSSQKIYYLVKKDAAPK